MACLAGPLQPAVAGRYAVQLLGCGVDGFLGTQKRLARLKIVVYTYSGKCHIGCAGALPVRAGPFPGFVKES
jgi:hypothetical protein